MVGALGRVACVFFCPLTARHLPRSMEAHCKVTTHYPLHSPPYSLLPTQRTHGGIAARGAPKRASHALLLLSSPYSLLSE